MKLRNLWKKATFVRQCEFGGHDYHPVEYRGKNFYLTTCICKEGFADCEHRMQLLDLSHEQWLASQPKTDEQRIADALESIAADMKRQVQREKSVMGEMYRILGEEDPPAPLVPLKHVHNYAYIKASGMCQCIADCPKKEHHPFGMFDDCEEGHNG